MPAAYAPYLVDAIILIVLAIYVYRHIQDGVFALVAQFLCFTGGAVLAFYTYGRVTMIALRYITLSESLLKAIVFLVLFAVFQFLLGLVFDEIREFIPDHVEWSKTSKIFAIIPALVDGLILISLALLLIATLPYFPQVKAPIEESHLGGKLVLGAAEIEDYAANIFGDAVSESGFFSIHPEEGESIALPWKPSKTSIDEESEIEMLKLVNEERAKVGAPALVMDQKIVAVARAHSLDMWQKQYFAHENPDGQSPFDRMEKGGVTFQSAGENLALSRTVSEAHIGLMNSPGHKRNILDPTYRRVGIGIIDGGIYGKMFTQDFAN